MDFVKVFGFFALITMVVAIPYEVEKRTDCEDCVLARCVGFSFL